MPPPHRGTILWDFDGTLADRPMTWSGSILAAFDVVRPAHGLPIDAIRLHTAKNFPWHEPEKDYLHLREPAAWWRSMEQMLANLAQCLGANLTEAAAIARAARGHIVDPAKYQTFPDVLPTLTALTAAGWRHAILSNNYPDLDAIVTGMGLRPHFTAVFTSALIGYEKPRREIYDHARSTLGETGRVWMIGDNESADAFGAEAAGIDAILVRKPARTFHRYAPDLHAARAIIG